MFVDECIKDLIVTGQKLSYFVEARHVLWSIKQQPECCNSDFGDLCLLGAQCLTLTTSGCLKHNVA